MFHNLQNYDSHLVFQEIGKYNFKLNVIPKAMEKCMSFTIQQPKKKGIKPELPLVFVDSVHFLNNSLNNLVENLGEDDFYHLSQEFNADVLNLLKKSYDYWDSLENPKKTYPAKINFIIH